MIRASDEPVSNVVDGSDDRRIRVVGLGGMNEIGMNCFAVSYGSDTLIVDCGVTFSHRDLGIDVIHPRFDYLEAISSTIRGLVITHGHEDHIGAIPYLLRKFDVPIFAPPYAKALIEERFEQHEPFHPLRLVATQTETPFEIGCFRIETLPVHHSVPDATALVIGTPGGTLVHTGDFKIEHDPIGSVAFPEERLRELGDEGVLLLMSDSTNSDVASVAGNERSVRDELDRLIQEAPGRVVVAVFGSNIERIRSITQAATRTKRHLCLLGRSIRKHVRIARELGLFLDTPLNVISGDRGREMDPASLLAVASGTQGEPMAALSRLARDDMPELSLEAGDTVILSSREIPGNELAIFEVQNAFEQRGIRVIHRRSHPGVHVSGHACRDEQGALLDLVRPMHFLPIHGTFHHLRRHAELAEERGIASTLVAQNGDIVAVDQAGLSICGRTRTGRVHIDHQQALDENIVRERELLGRLGAATVAIAYGTDSQTVRGVRVSSRGFLSQGENQDDVHREAEDFVSRKLARLAPGEREAERVQTVAHKSLRQFLGTRFGRKPLVTAIVIGDE